MSLNLYSYLREGLRVAVCKSFPDMEVSSCSIPLFFKSPSPSADLNTPIALRISSIKKMSPEIAANSIVSCFDWNEKYIISDLQNHETVTEGFICFRTSLSFQYETLKKAAGNAPQPLETLCNLKLPDKTLELLHQTAPLLRYSETALSSGFIFEPIHFSLLNSSQERKLIRLIAVSQTEELYSSGAAAFFWQELTRLLSCYLNRIPIFNANEELTLSRVTLVRACHNRIVSLCKHIYISNRAEKLD